MLWLVRILCLMAAGIGFWGMYNMRAAAVEYPPCAATATLAGALIGGLAVMTLAVFVCTLPTRRR